MIELGNTAGAAYAGPEISKMYGRASDSPKTTASRKILYEDRSAAVIQNRFRSERSRFVTGQLPDSEQLFMEMQKSLNSGKFLPVNLQEEYIKALRAQANVEPGRALQLLKAVAA